MAISRISMRKAIAGRIWRKSEIANVKHERWSEIQQHVWSYHTSSGTSWNTGTVFSQKVNKSYTIGSSPISDSLSQMAVQSTTHAAASFSSLKRSSTKGNTKGRSSTQGGKLDQRYGEQDEDKGYQELGISKSRERKKTAGSKKITMEERLDRIRGRKLEIIRGTPISVGDFAKSLGATIDDLYTKAASLGVEFRDNRLFEIRTLATKGKAESGRRKEEREMAERRKQALITDEDAEILAQELGVVVHFLEKASIDVGRAAPASAEEYASFPPRPPIVTVMGHVDHGKTTLMDALRSAHNTELESGGITQTIGSFQCQLGNQTVTILDTPGHEAFTAMRMSGAACTDIVVLVVAADDGVKPQTLEAISHARAANAAIVVAINKIDMPGADPRRVQVQLLSEAGLAVEQQGGDVPCVMVSAKKKQNLDELVETILLQAEMMDLRANPNARAEAICIESKLDPKHGGIIANCIMRTGTLREGNFVVAGNTWGIVRSMRDHNSKVVKERLPSQPFALLGLRSLISGADDIIQVESESRAHQVSQHRLDQATRAKAETDSKIAAAALMQKRLERSAGVNAGAEKHPLHVSRRRGILPAMAATTAPDGPAEEDDLKINLILKADSKGSVDALKTAVEGLEVPGVVFHLVHVGVGHLNPSDISLAAVSGATIYYFASSLKFSAKQVNSFKFDLSPEISGMVSRLKVRVVANDIIFKLLDTLKEHSERVKVGGEITHVRGSAEVRELFALTGKLKGTTVAGCKVVDGSMKRSFRARVMRTTVDEDSGGSKDTIVYDGKISSLKHFQEEVGEIKSGKECGIILDGFSDLLVGDRIEVYEVEIL